MKTTEIGYDLASLPRCVRCKTSQEVGEIAVSDWIRIWGVLEIELREDPFDGRNKVAGGRQLRMEDVLIAIRRVDAESQLRRGGKHTKLGDRVLCNLVASRMRQAYKLMFGG
jgi:hypothetical protein